MKATHSQTVFDRVMAELAGHGRMSESCRRWLDGSVSNQSLARALIEIHDHMPPSRWPSAYELVASSFGLRWESVCVLVQCGGVH